uniref:Uncharacterized protein n=1 Tax=Arion vulgaris TaxID=1028688 RepID=A0A0B7A9V8_9EUPU
MIMIVGLPGSGKTTWAINMQKNHPEKRYNIIGTDTLIDKMRVMGLPRKRNYHGRWEVLIDKATKCLNKYFIIAAKRRRNYILDQTNVYGSARKRKMKNFSEFYRIAAVIQPDDPELERRSKKRTQEDGKVVPESAVLEMKANFSLPEDRDNLFDRIDFIELHKDVVQQLVRTYNQEGKPKPRQDSSQNRFDGNKKQVDQRHQPYGGYESRSYDRSASYDKDSSSRNRDHWYSDRDEIPAKRIKPDPGSALDLLKEQYEEDDRQPPAHKGALSRPTWSDPIKIKEERIASPSSQWPPNYSQGLSHTTSFQPGLLGAPPVPNHEAQLAFHHPGMPPPPPSELAGLSLAAKARQDMSVRTGSPYTFGSQATGQNLYEAASPTYEPRVDRQMWHPTEEQQYPTVEQREQQITSWQQEQEEILLKSYAKPWEQDRSSNSWQSDFQDRRDERDFHNRGSGNSRDSSFNRFDSRDRNKDSDRDRDRDRNQDRDYGYNRNSDRGDYYNNDRDHRDGGYSRDSRSSWNSQSYGSSTLDRQDCGSDSGKLDRQRKRKSKWDQPGEDQTASLDQVKHEPDDDAFNNDHSQHAENMYNQPPPGFLGPRFSTSPSQPIRPSSTSRTATNQDTKPTSFDVNYSRQPPPLMGNLKSEFLGTSKDSNTPEIKFSPVGNGGDGLLGQGPGPKSLIAGLQGNLSDQLKAKGSGPPQVGGNDSSRTKNVDSSISSTRKPFSLDANTGKGTDNADDNKRPTPAPLIKMEEEQSSSPPDKDSTSDPSDRARCGQDKPGLFPTPGASEVDVGSSFRPRGPPGLMGRFPGPPTGPQPPVGGPGMLGHGPSSSNMGSRPLRGGPRGPPHGQMGGPPRGPMGGPRGPGPWNQNHPRFGPHGPLRPLFDGPPGRWPRPSR